MTFPLGTPPPIRVFICDDMSTMRELLRATLHLELGIVVVGEADDGIGAIRGIQTCRPDVAVLDIRLPRADGIDVLRAIRRTVPETRAVMFSAHGTPKLARATLELGASSFIEKTAPMSDLVAAIRSARPHARPAGAARSARRTRAGRRAASGLGRGGRPRGDRSAPSSRSRARPPYRWP